MTAPSPTPAPASTQPFNPANPSNPCGPAPRREDLAALSHSQLIERYARSVENLDRRIVQTRIDDDILDMSFLPDAGVGRWSCRVLLGHLADAELLFTQRMRRVLAETNPVFWVWDEDTFVDSGIYGTEQSVSKLPVAGAIGTIFTLRRWTLDLLRSLTPDAFDRKGLHPERGEMSLRTILEYDVWHLEHHAWYLNRKLDRVLGPAEEKVQGGCGSGNCGCKGGPKH
jgi:hypothetical protein